MEQKKVKRRSRIKKYLLVGLIAIIVLSIPAHFIWKNSGSGEWELSYDKPTRKVWSKKIPGQVWTQYKTYGQLEASMKTIVRFVRDPRAAEDAGVYDAQMIDSISPQLMYYSFKQKFLWPFKPREYVVKSNFVQDTLSKEIYTDFICFPDLVPREDNGCHRVEKMNNQWRFIPIGNGKVEYYYETDSEDPGGYFPYFLGNFMNEQIFIWLADNMQDILNKKSYQEASDLEYVLNVE